MSRDFVRPVLAVQEENVDRAVILQNLGKIEGLQFSAMEPAVENLLLFLEIRAYRPGLIFIDSAIPTQDGGMGLAKDILESDLQAKVVMLAGAADAQAVRRRGESLGVWDVLEMPYDHPRLESLVRLWVTLGGSRRISETYVPTERK